MVKTKWACLCWKRKKQGQSGSWFHIFEGPASDKGGQLFSSMAREKLGPLGSSHGTIWRRKWLGREAVNSQVLGVHVFSSHEMKE